MNEDLSTLLTSSGVYTWVTHDEIIAERARPAAEAVEVAPLRAVPHFCCDQFAALWHAERITFDDGEWNIPGCCTTCYVVIDVRACPYCGATLPVDFPETAA